MKRLLSLFRKLPRLRSLSSEQLRDLLSAQWAVLSAHRQVRSRPLGELVAVSGSAGRSASAADPRQEDRVAWSVITASNHGLTRPTCLVRSLAIQKMLRDRGLPQGQIRIGVRWKDDEFLAHAWVERDERVIGDTRRHVSGFDPVTDMRMVKF